jgi:hypothetical protein
MRMRHRVAGALLGLMAPGFGLISATAILFVAEASIAAPATVEATAGPQAAARAPRSSRARCGGSRTRTTAGSTCGAKRRTSAKRLTRARNSTPRSAACWFAARV